MKQSLQCYNITMLHFLIGLVLTMQHFKMYQLERESMLRWFSSAIINVLTHGIRHCCFLFNAFPVMIYFTALFIDLLGQSAFPPQVSRIS